MPDGLFTRLMHALPGQCRVCHAWPARTVCDDCVAQFGQPQPRCRSCALPLPSGPGPCGACIRQPPPLDLCLAAVPYAYPWATLIQDFKFHGQPGLARSLATLLRATPWAEPALEAADWLLPMPLSPQRLLERGYNQAALLARALDARRTRDDLLLRVRDTPPQHSLSRPQRLRALQQAFDTAPQARTAVAGRAVVLVDDVMTTGASLHAAATALRAAGAARVTALVIARTE